MSRPVISVRRVSADEERSFTELWMTSRVEAGVSPEVVARAASEGRISTALHREANRFFARLGFSSQMVRRVTTVSALRRRLGQDEPRHHSIEALLHRRRSLRARATATASAESRLAG